MLGIAGALLFCGSGAINVHAEVVSAREPLPRLVLWAWERPEDLTYIDPVTTAVAFHAAHIRIEGSRLRVKRRRHPLHVAPATPLVAVAHFSVAAPDERVRPRARELLLALARQPGVRALQLDFEAVPSQRGFYARLAAEVRERLPAHVGFSATALTSWCLGDRWLDPAPFDEVVPMYFHMGRSEALIRRHFDDGGDFIPDYCRTSVGIAAGDAVPGQFAGRRIYVFNPKPWSPAAYRRLKESS